tara:strand:- start:670 stop:1461 length:792 start_codon:yes stop_codon:yes gene_type:complete
MSEEIYECITCSTKYKRKDYYKKHLLTPKHLNANKKVDNNFQCAKCGRCYKHKSSLSKHVSNCPYNNMVSHESKTHDLEKMFITMIEENNELKKSIKDLTQKVGPTHIQNNFNLNVFLNEKCKHALNIKDFIKSLKIELDDIYYTKNNGLEKSISNIFLNGLKELGEYKRPIHCSDAKRQTFYIKDENAWEKDTNKEKLKKSINVVQDKHIKILTDWEDNNPNWKNNDQKKDEYIAIVQQVMCTINEDKVVREISKKTIIEDK